MMLSLANIVIVRNVTPLTLLISNPNKKKSVMKLSLRAVSSNTRKPPAKKTLNSVILL